MASTISFGRLNSGSQIGINYGLITNDFRPLDRTDRDMDLDKKLPTVGGAAFDSYADQHEAECLPGTRTDILCKIREWAFSPQGQCIFWLNGMAGTGKSTISRTVATSFNQTKSLGASFFFRRGETDRGNAMKLFPIIARQLSTSIPALLPYIQQAVLDDPDIAGKEMKEQFEKLLRQPLLSVGLFDLPIQTLVIVIDALDECEGDSDIRLILQLLPQLQKLNTLCLRVFLTSRPELPIRLGFSKLDNHDFKDLVLHEIPLEEINHDISLFLHHRISEIRAERLLPTDWPGDTNLQKLVELCVPLFISAATICRLFEDPDWDPVDSLTELLTHQNDEFKLDGTYLPVLDRLLGRQQKKKKKEQLIKEVRQVVGAILILESPLSVLSLSGLLEMSESLIQLRLDSLRSVLHVPDNQTLPVRLFHTSFRDFLLDLETRDKTPFWIDRKAVHNQLAIRCLRTCYTLRKNICALPSDGTRRAEVDRPTIDRYVPPELQYACRYWSHHLVNCTESKNLMQDSFLFLQRHFLHWMEAMSLLGLISEVVWVLEVLQTATLNHCHPAMSDFIYDAKRFVLKNRQIADEAPLQLYCAGLIFAPSKSMIREGFGTELPTWICQLPRVEERWSTGLQVLEGHLGGVNSVAFSPNGRLLASGSADRTVQLWDPATGTLQRTLKGHLAWIRSVAFSPNGWLLASGSDDKTVQLWDLITGALRQTLKGHSGFIMSVAFSPNGQLLASGSSDKIVQVWHLATGALQQTLNGHSGLVMSVAFSPKGKLLASGSSDNTVRLWDAATGVLKQALEGHSYWANSVAFSPDGRLLASGSDDKTVRLWDPATSALQQTLEGHSAWVRSVAFSPNGRLLASGSDDRTVRLWNPSTGALQQTLEGHSNFVNSVAFSPDGRMLASGSDDETVRLWIPATGALYRTLGFNKGVTAGVTEIQFSEDGSSLNTNLGDLRLDIQPRSDFLSTTSPQMNLKISIDNEYWINLNNKKSLWLPAESRPTCSAIHGSIVALGHASGGFPL
ncbi:NACHT and WD40 domain protein [Penicillium canescens]|nr:NACHT and WD40 domain protein [Penicillium canescens]